MKRRIINYRTPGSSAAKKIIKKAIYRLERLIPGRFVLILRRMFGSSEIFGFKFWSVRNRLLRRTELILDKNKLSKKARDYYAVVCGSDKYGLRAGLILPICLILFLTM